jgi:PAS domain S-box-containing protein
VSGFNDALLASILEGCGDAVVVMTREGVIARWNGAAERLYGITEEEARGQSIAMLSRPGGADYLHSAIAAAGGRSSSFDAEHVRPDGIQVQVAVTVAPVRDETGVIGVWCTARDVTERKRAERERERLTEASELTDAVISIDLDGRVCHWSPGAERLFGFSAAQVVGLGLDELNALSGEPEEAGERWRRLMPLVLEAEAPFVHQLQRRHKDGTVVDLLGRIIPWHRDGHVVGVTGLLIDVTERKRVEREFARLAQAAEYGTDAVVSMDFGGSEGDRR